MDNVKWKESKPKGPPPKLPNLRKTIENNGKDAQTKQKHKEPELLTAYDAYLSIYLLHW